MSRDNVTERKYHVTDSSSNIEPCYHQQVPTVECMSGQKIRPPPCPWCEKLPRKAGATVNHCIEESQRISWLYDLFGGSEAG